MERFLIIQTAFLGDLVLTLPVIQVLKKEFPQSSVDLLLIPSTYDAVKDNPLIAETIIYDKRSGSAGDLLSLGRKLKEKSYDVLISPHRSARSAMLGKLAGAKKSISFDTSSLSFLYGDTVNYRKDVHEILRNLDLLRPLGIAVDEIVKPEMYTGETEKNIAGRILHDLKLTDKKFIAVAHGSVWNTKRFPEEKFSSVISKITDAGIDAVLVGGKEDTASSERISSQVNSTLLRNLTGKLSIQVSSEIIRWASLLLTNDSAPLHIGNAVNTTVFAIFGSTVPAFGFFPYNKEDRVYEVNGLDCRPCGIHGRTKCPIGTLECMYRIDDQRIAADIIASIGQE